jgi:hypothetical protein
MRKSPKPAAAGESIVREFLPICGKGSSQLLVFARRVHVAKNTGIVYIDIHDIRLMPVHDIAGLRTVR